MRKLLLVVFCLLCVAGFLSLVSAQSSNLIQNGGFETGTISPWQDATNSNIVSSDKHSGNYSIRFTSGGAAQGWISVTPGRTYVLTAWYKWNQFTGSNWGYDRIEVIDNSWATVVQEANLHNKYQQGVWNKVALVFTPTRNQVRVNIGMFGPQDSVEIFFDDIELFEKTGNLPPSLSPSASITSGNIPLSVNFSANAQDKDGAIAVYRWEFGDGSEERIVNPSHTYISPGSFQAKLTVWDNEGASAQATINITVQGNVPLVTINSPTSNSTYQTSATSLSLSGLASSSNSTITLVVWDNVSNSQAGIASGTTSWSTPSIPLKAGENEILITAKDALGKVGTDKIVVTRNVSGPIISNVSINTSLLPVYEKFEVTFDLETVAKYPMFMYDSNPPQGVEPAVGVTVEGVFTSPSGKILRQPGFYFRDVNKSNNVYQEAGTKDRWAVRFAPEEQGAYQVSLQVRDASGTTTRSVGTFVATAPTKQGFIRVSKDDPRYFEFSNRELFWPIGPAWVGDDAASYKNTGINFDRPWMAGEGAYSTNFARWLSSSERHGNEGIMNRLNFKEHYPGHELSRDLFYPEGFRIWIPNWEDNIYHGQLKANANYQLKIRLKIQNLAGPRNTSYPWGFTIKLSGFLSHEASVTEVENTLRSKPIILPHITANNDWHTIVTTFRMNTNTAESDLNLFLDNVTAGQVFIDELSIREILGDGSLGPEFVRQSRADMHTYVDQRPMAYFDRQVDSGAQNGVYFKYVVHDKNDWIQNHLSSVGGVFVSSGDGYYQPENTKATWLQKQWWRYLVARLGYSVAVHSWELNNEGFPDNGSGTHARHTQLFAKWMHDMDAHPHLATTSFWSGWEPTFWGDKQKFPDVDYADIHKYSGQDRFSDGTFMGYDAARFTIEDSLWVASDKIGKPIIRGETGLFSPGQTQFSYLQQVNPGIWYHNLLWGQLNPGGMSDPNYWWSEHINRINRFTIATPFWQFIKSLDINKGGYSDIAASVSNTNLRVTGQKNTAKGKAYLWVQNKLHTWRNVMGVDNPTPVTPQSGTVSFTVNPNTTYTLEQWNTYTGAMTQSNVTSNSSGLITLTINNLSDDTAFKLDAGLVQPSPTPTATPTPTPSPVCRADVNKNGRVEIGDISGILFYWGQSCTGSGSVCQADVNTNGKVEIGDIAGVLFYWNNTCSQ